MKHLTLAALTTLVLFGAPDAVAADCAGELTASKPVPTLTIPLPPACRAMGPLHLGMSYAQMIAVMGTPDTAATPAVAYRDAVYVFPHDLAVQLRRHPIPQAEVRYGQIEIVFHNDRAVTISIVVNTPSITFPYSVGGIAIGDSIDKLLTKVKTHHAWNAAKDHVGFYPYPISVDASANGRIFGINISNNLRPKPGPTIRFHWIKDPASDLVRGYHITAGPLTSGRGPLAR